MENIIVIGVDPAPAKGLCVSYPKEALELCDGLQPIKHYSTNTEDLRAFCSTVKKLSEVHAVLICWDAPLTFCEQQDSPKYNHSQYYCRPIEAFINKHIETNASVQPYTGCSHWAITQRLLGYPSWIEGETIGEPLLGPSTLLTTQATLASVSVRGIYVVEVHPALAMSLKDTKGDGLVRQYKGSKKYIAEDRKYNAAEKYAACENLYQEYADESLVHIKGIQADDIVDARCARWLGENWLNKKTKTPVVCYGNAETGSFLLPQNTILDKLLPSNGEAPIQK